MIDDLTEAQHWPLPHPDNLLAEDVLRLRDSLSGIDKTVAALIQSAGLNAAAVSVALELLQAADAALRSDMGASVAALQKSLSALDAGKVSTVNGRGGVAIVLKPADLGLAPTDGPSRVALAYDANGQLIQIDATRDGKPETTLLTYAAGVLTGTKTSYDGKASTSTFSYDGNGALTTIETKVEDVNV